MNRIPREPFGENFVIYRGDLLAAFLEVAVAKLAERLAPRGMDEKAQEFGDEMVE